MTKKVCYNVTNLSPQSSMTHCRVRPEQKNPDTVFDWTKSEIFKELQLHYSPHMYPDI